MESVAVVILNYNGKLLLEQFLPKVIQYSAEAKIYIADNNSTDNSKEYIKNYFPQVHWIQIDKNRGYAGGYNYAIAQVKEPILCLLNTDVEVTPNWLNPIVKIFKENPNIGIIQPKILDLKNKDTYEYAGAAGGFIDQYGFAYCRGRIFYSIEKDYNQYPSKEIFWASGACFFIRKKTFHDLEGFDEDFFAHQEEIDLCWRAFNANITTYYCNESTIYHQGGATLNQNNPNKTFLNFRNSLFMLYKNAPLRGRFALIFKRLCLDGLAGIQMMLQLKPLHCFAVVRSHFAFYIHLPKLKHKRKQQEVRKDYFSVKSIVKKYFLEGKKKYTDL